MSGGDRAASLSPPGPASSLVLPPGAVADQFHAFEDRPLNWDAWDTDIFYDDKLLLAEPAGEIWVLECGPLRATVEIRRCMLHSSYTQRLSLTYNSPRLDCETVIAWRERHNLLKAAFPVEILAPTAVCEIQWGHVERPTHRFTCSLYRHPAVVPYAIGREAYALNDPILALSAGGSAGKPLASLVTASPGIIVETIKRAEDGHGILIRAYESNRERGPATLDLGFPVKAAALTNLLEEDQVPLTVEGRKVLLNVRPFQILDVRLLPA